MITANRRKLKTLILDKTQRQQMAVRLYRPMSTQLPFHQSLASERLIFGGVQSGKTLCVAAELSSAALGIPLTAADGTAIPLMYPKNNLTIWVIGYDENHISLIYEKLFKSNPFRIIKDAANERIRAWNPNDPADAAREDETHPAPPLIPGGPECRLDGAIKNWAWLDKGKRQFRICRLRNGTEIVAWSSKAEAGQGAAIDIIWIDEDIYYQQHVAEWQSRLSGKRGRLMWSAWPHDSNEAIRQMQRRAANQRGRANPDVEVFQLAFSKNPYIPHNEKRKRLEGWAESGEAVMRARDLGELAGDSQRVYPNFNIDIHGVPRKEGPDVLEMTLAANNWQVPYNWTRYLALDPGHANAAAVFGAVPPPELGDYLYIYDEVFAQRIDADGLASMIADKAGNDNAAFHAFIIDAHAGRQTVLGGGKRVIEFYMEAFRKYNLKSTLTEYGFLGGCDNPQVRNMVVRSWLNPRADGTTLLRFNSDKTYHMQREFSEYKQTITRSEMTDKPIDVRNHSMDGLSYLSEYIARLFAAGIAHSPVIDGPTSLPTVQNVLKSLNERYSGRTNPNGSFHIGAGAT